MIDGPGGLNDESNRGIKTYASYGGTTVQAVPPNVNYDEGNLAC